MSSSTPFTQAARVEKPIICGAMYPCSNPELVAAASQAGGLGVVQPLSLIYVHKYDFREGLRKIKSLTDKPFGFNVLTEQSSKIYLERMSRWVDIALEEGCRFFITALGNPKWIVDRVGPLGGVVYHDVTERKWALKARDAGVQGLICVNNRAGGHAGTLPPEELMRTLGDLGLPLICAGGVGSEADVQAARGLGYAGVQLGTRFIATTECTAHDDYKQAILKATSRDIVLTERLTGVPVSIIRTPTVEKEGLKAGPVAKLLLKNPRLKHYMRLYYSLKSLRTLNHASMKGVSYLDYWQAGKSVDGIERIEPVAEVMARLGRAWAQPAG
jgi:nitronate monooxygenase